MSDNNEIVVKGLIQNLLITEGFGSVSDTFTLAGFAPSPTQLVLIFTDTVAVTTLALSPTSWIITGGTIPVNVLSVRVAGNEIELDTTEHQQGVTYTLSIPGNGLSSASTGLAYTGTLSQMYTGVALIPVLVMARSVSGRSVIVTYSKPMDKTTATVAQNYAISGPTAVQVALSTQISANEYQLTTTVHMHDSTYTVTATNVMDTRGNSV